MSLKIILTAVLSSCISLLHAQNTGKISGKILDKISMNPLIGATVLLDGNTKGMGAVIDINGPFICSIRHQLLANQLYRITSNYHLIDIKCLSLDLT